MADRDRTDRPHAATSAEDDADELIAEPGASVVPGQNVEGASSDEAADPAFEAVIEAGGGVAEGYEQSEAALVDHATTHDEDATERVLEDAPPPEEPHQGEYGEADHVRNAGDEESAGA